MKHIMKNTAAILVSLLAGSFIGAFVTFSIYSRLILSELDHAAHINQESKMLKINDATEVGVNEEKCKLSPNDPIPVILWADGRTGSSSTWDVLSTLSGKRNKAIEYTGSNADYSQVFFDNLADDPSVEYDWAVQHLCDLQQNDEDSDGSGIIGFQWKPLPFTLIHEYGKTALKELGQQENPRVPFVYQTRNPIDMRISVIKHEDKTLPAHCLIGDEECAKRMEKLTAGNNRYLFPTGRGLLNYLDDYYRDQKDVIKTLEKYGISYVHVHYEKLYYLESAEEWMRTFRLLGKGPAEGLTMDDVHGAMELAPTHPKSRSEMLSNFEEVKKTLEGTSYSFLLDDTYDDYDKQFMTIMSQESNHLKFLNMQATEGLTNNERQCELSPDKATPVVVMAHAMTGLGATWDVLSARSGKKNSISDYIGHNPDESQEFFDKLEDDASAGYGWANQHLCDLQQSKDALKGSGIVGLAWKPFPFSMIHEYGCAALWQLGLQENPRVPFIFLTRNPIDMKLSMMMQKELPTKKLRASDAIDFFIERKLLNYLDEYYRDQNEVLKTLDEYGISYVHVHYEKLYYTESAEEWMKVFRLIGKGPKEGLTMDDVHEASELAPTHPINRSEMMSNFEEVKKTLEGTMYSFLLDETYDNYHKHALNAVQSFD